jgi:hypothetical protein
VERDGPRWSAGCAWNVLGAHTGGSNGYKLIDQLRGLQDHGYIIDSLLGCHGAAPRRVGGMPVVHFAGGGTVACARGLSPMRGHRVFLRGFDQDNMSHLGHDRLLADSDVRKGLFQKDRECPQSL